MTRTPGHWHSPGSLAYSENLADERKETAAAFWTRAQNFSGQAGITLGVIEPGCVSDA